MKWTKLSVCSLSMVAVWLSW